MALRWWIVGGVALLLLVGFWFAIGGFDLRHNAPEWLTERPIAHRGLHSGDAVVPENSVAAFEAAAEAGFAVELDVLLSANGVPVVIHDENLQRLTGDPRDVSEVSSDELGRLHLLGSAETVPTLSEALHSVDGRVPVFIEVKNPGGVGALEDAVAREVTANKGPVAVMSFNPLSLARIREKAPGVPRGQLTGTFEGESLSFIKKFVLGRTLMNWSSQPDFVADELAALPSFGAWLQKRQGRPLIVWLATAREQYRRASELGDAVIFELDARP